MQLIRNQIPGDAVKTVGRHLELASSTSTTKPPWTAEQPKHRQAAVLALTILRGEDPATKRLSDLLDASRGEGGSYQKKSDCSASIGSKKRGAKNKPVRTGNLHFKQLAKEEAQAKETETADHQRIRH